MLGIREAREMPQAVSVNTVPLSALTINIPFVIYTSHL